MLQRMGWKGAGLGVEETGIVEPVKGGEVRDRADMYRGMGNSQVGKQLDLKSIGSNPELKCDSGLGSCADPFWQELKEWQSPYVCPFGYA